MKKFQKIFSGVSLGLLVCLIFVYSIEAIGHFIFPLPHKLSVNVLDDIEILRNHIRAINPIAMIFPLLSYVFGSIAGGYVANRISKRVLAGILVGCILLLLHLIVLKTIPHPAWYIFISCAIPVPGALLGGNLSKFQDLKKGGLGTYSIDK